MAYYALVSLVPVLLLLLATLGLFLRRLSFGALWKYESPLAARSVLVVIRKTLTEQAKAFLMLLTAGALLIVTLGIIAVVHWLSASSAGSRASVIRRDGSWRYPPHSSSRR